MIIKETLALSGVEYRRQMQQLVAEYKPAFRYLRRLFGVQTSVGYGSLPEINNQANSFAVLALLARHRGQFYLPSGRGVDFHPDYQNLLLRPRAQRANQTASVVSIYLPREQSHPEQQEYFFRGFDESIAGGVFAHELAHHLILNGKFSKPERVGLVKLATDPWVDSEIWQEIAANLVVARFGFSQSLERALQFCLHFPGANQDYYRFVLDHLRHLK